MNITMSDNHYLEAWRVKKRDRLAKSRVCDAELFAVAVAIFEGTATASAIWGAVASIALSYVASSIVGRGASSQSQNQSVSTRGIQYASSSRVPPRTQQVQISPPAQAQPQNFAVAANQRTNLIRSAIAPRQVVYGRAMLSGPMIFACGSPGNVTQFFTVPGTPSTIVNRETITDIDPLSIAGGATVNLAGIDGVAPIPPGTVFKFLGITDTHEYVVVSCKHGEKAIDPDFGTYFVDSVLTNKPIDAGVLSKQIQVVKGSNFDNIKAGMWIENPVETFPDGRHHYATIASISGDQSQAYASQINIVVQNNITGHTFVGGDLPVRDANNHFQLRVGAGFVTVIGWADNTHFTLASDDISNGLRGSNNATDADHRDTVGTRIWSGTSDTGYVEETGYAGDPTADITTTRDVGSNIVQWNAERVAHATDSVYATLTLTNDLADTFSIDAGVSLSIFSDNANFANSQPFDTLVFKSKNGLGGGGVGNVIPAGTQLNLTAVAVAAVPDQQLSQTFLMDNQFLHLVIPLTAHEVDAIEAVYFNDVPSLMHGYNTVKTYLGTQTQVADADLIAASKGRWTVNHKLTGVAYIYVKLEWNDSAWPTGIPNIKALVRGKKIYDPETTTTAWTDNWALCLRDYLTSAEGLNCDTSEIDDTSFIAAKHVSDLPISVVSLPSATSTTIGTGSKTFTLTVATAWDVGTTYAVNALVLYGGVTYISLANSNTGNTPPAPVNAPSSFWAVRSAGFFVGGMPVHVFRTSDPTKYMDGVVTSYSVPPMLVLSIASVNGSGTFSDWTITGTQKNYRCNGAASLDLAPVDIIKHMSSAGAGFLTYNQGVFSVVSGAYTASVLTFTESDLRGPLVIHPKPPRRDLFNGVKGKFIDSNNYWQPTDFPLVTNTAYVTEDQGEVITHDIDLPFTNEVVAAQRIAKIALMRGRGGITVDFPCKLSGLSVRCGDTIALTIAQLGWVAMEFQVTNWKLSPSTPGVDLTLTEINAEMFDWNLGQEGTISTVLSTNLPSRILLPPTNLILAEVLRLENNNYVAVSTIDFSPSTDARFHHYEVQAAILSLGLQTTAPDFHLINNGRQTHYEYRNLDAERVMVRVRAVSSWGSVSPWVTGSILLAGAAGYVTAVGLSSPTNPRIFLTTDADGNTPKVKFTCGYDVNAAIIPQAVALMVSVTDHPNVITVSGTGTTLTVTVNANELLGQGTFDVLAGSTTSALVITTPEVPLPDTTSIAGMIWVKVPGSKWRKAIRSDDTTIYFDVPFDVSPTIGAAMANWSEVSWVDMREPEFRFGFLPSGEILRWGNIDVIGNIAYLIDCERAVEGTTLSVADNTPMYYLPAPGHGTNVISLPVANFQPTDVAGVFSCAVDTSSLVVKAGQVVSVSCACYAQIGAEYVRSNIVPVAYFGPQAV